jgi:Uma2 family endonuclease
MKEYKSNSEEEVSQFSELDLSKTYNYAQYLKWAFDERLELIKGRIFQMSPAPARIHQKISGNIFHFLKGQTCEVYTAPFDVRLPRIGKGPGSASSDKDITTVVQPDICVVCDPAKLDDRGCIGAPDIVVEILSPGNNRKEMQNKYEVYEEAGVKEYWIVWPEHNTFMRYVLDEKGKYQPSRIMTVGEEITTPVLPAFVLRLDDVFRD